MKHIKAIDADLVKKKKHAEIVRKIYLTFPTYAFEGDLDAQFNILNDISVFCSVPITSVQIVGSGKTGYSFHKKREFIPGTSDLDIAIIDSALFLKYMDRVFNITDGYRLGQNFPMDIVSGGSAKNSYLHYISKGIFVFDYMPACPERADWRAFFGNLTKEYSNMFKSVSARLYLSQSYFEDKQRSMIEHHISNKEKSI